MSTKRVVVAPLDWGLGHATRCIPIIKALLLRNCEVWIASSGSALKLVRHEFPELRFKELPSYNVTYSTRLPFMAAIFFQLPKFLRVIQEEHRAMEEWVRLNQIDCIISDNRYGCWSSVVRSIFITHQVNIRMPKILRWLEPVVAHFNHRFIKKFSACWIPDVPQRFLSGELSQPNHLPAFQFIGWLSRFSHQIPLNRFSGRIAIAVILSGPEPQRTVMENIVKPQLLKINKKTILVRGIVEHEITQTEVGGLTVFNFLDTEALNELLVQSDVVVARSGYSTLMDLAHLGKRAIVIPTPGQTEQEYLADRLSEKGYCVFLKQNAVDLEKALRVVDGIQGFAKFAEHENHLLKKALDELLD